MVVADGVEVIGDASEEVFEEAFELVRISIARAFQRQQRHYDGLRRRPWKPKIGEWVWKRDYPLSNKANARNAKLAPKFRDPLKVRQIISPVIVDLRDKSGRWYRHIHVKDLKSAPSEKIPADETEASVTGTPASEAASDNTDSTREFESNAEREDEKELTNINNG